MHIGQYTSSRVSVLERAMALQCPAGILLTNTKLEVRFTKNRMSRTVPNRWFLSVPSKN